MKLTLIALLLAGIAGCGSEPADNTQRPVEEPKLETGNGGDEEPKSETENGSDEEPEPGFEATLEAAEQGDADAQCNLGSMYDDDLGVTGEGADTTLDLETIDESFILTPFQLTNIDGI